MTWVAKNSITGKEYGKTYDSIYDCQAFIDRELQILEYELQKTFSLEKEIIKNLKIKEKKLGIQGIIMESINQALEDLKESKEMKQLEDSIKICMLEKEEKIHEEIRNLTKIYWSKNNIIRCYEKNQKRYAEGMDF